VSDRRRDAAPRADSRGSHLGAGLALALLLAGLEAATDLLLPAAPFQIDAFGRAGLVAPLPALGLALGFLLGRAYPLVALGIAWLAARVGRYLVLGPQARELPYAEHWDLIAGGLTLAVFFLIYLGRSRATLGRRLRWALAPCLLGGYGIAVFVQRGHYREIREGGLIGIAAVGIALMAPGIPPLRGRALRLGAMASALLFLVGVVAITRSGQVSEWAHHRTSLTTAYARPLWKSLGRGLPEVAPDEGMRRRPYFGTELARATTRKLFPAKRPGGVLLVTVDALRYDVVGRVIEGKSVTPYLDSLIASGFSFDRAYAPANLTNATFASVFSGSYPSEILARPQGLSGLPLVTHRLRDAGVRSRGLFFWVVAAGGLYGDQERASLGFEPEYPISMRDPEPAEVLAKLAPDDVGPWFSFVHRMRPHWPYDSGRPEDDFAAPDEEFAGYLAEVRRADAELREIVEGLRAHAETEGDDFWIIVAADHGEEFGEHGLRFHGLQLFEESIHVPLIFAGPGVPQGRSERVVSLLDLAPTLDDIFGTGDATRAPTSGRSLLPLVAGLEDSDRAPVVAAEMPDLRRRIRARALIRARRKTVAQIERGTIQHYDLQDDPGETRDLSRDPEFRLRMEEDLAALAALVAADSPVEPQGRSLNWGLAEEIETLPRAGMIDRLNASPSKDLIALVAPFISAREAKDLLDAGSSSGLSADARLWLRAAAGEDAESLRRHLVRVVSQSRDPLVVLATLPFLTRRSEAGLVDAKAWRPAEPRARLAVDLAWETYRASFGGRPLNFRLVEEALGSGGAYLPRLAAEYLATLPASELPEGLRGSFYRAWKKVKSPRHRAVLVSMMARWGGEEFARVSAEVWRAGEVEERSALAGALIEIEDEALLPQDAARPLNHSLLARFRGEGGLRLPVEAFAVPAKAKELWMRFMPPPGIAAPWPVSVEIGARTIEIDAGRALPGGALRLALRPEDIGQVLRLSPAKEGRDARTPGLIGVFAR
jgi:arylsulfatase A-like enzyme